MSTLVKDATDNYLQNDVGFTRIGLKLNVLDFRENLTFL